MRVALAAMSSVAPRVVDKAAEAAVKVCLGGAGRKQPTHPSIFSLAKVHWLDFLALQC